MYVQCRTIIDCCKQLQWPTELPERPMVGDYIRSTSSTMNKHIELVVGSVTWYKTSGMFGEAVWAVEVYLDMPPHCFQNIEHFERFIKRSDDL